MKTAVVILNYNGQRLLEQFLGLAVDNSPEGEVIVIDNASSDGSVDFIKSNFPDMQVVQLDRNYGFADGYNLGLKKIEADYFVLLNSDVAVTPNWLTPLINTLEKSTEIVACQPKLMSYNEPQMFEYAGAAGGFLDKYGYPFCRGRIFNTIETDHGQYDTPYDLFWATGACLTIRADKYWEMGGLDGAFFAHQEEIDLCWRIKARGFRILCVPDSKVFHVGAKTLEKEHPHKTYLNFRNNHLMLYKNTAKGEYRKIAIIRFFLDYLAALQMLLFGQPKNAWSVAKARFDFWRMKPDFSAIREKNRVLATSETAGLYKKSILWQYHARGKKLYSQLEE